MNRILRAAVAGALLAGLVSAAACGGRQDAPSAEREPPPPPTCLPDRWERPPSEIGEVPPSREAPAGALIPFRVLPLADVEEESSSPSEEEETPAEDPEPTDAD
ncbi:MAG: hypothetical protein EA398_17035 [Deltaproteobacteria bacterium]|nr:MAG: hypothetical protein EA398_17035 [Deltaproteobacteria bacterium]